MAKSKSSRRQSRGKISRSRGARNYSKLYTGASASEPAPVVEKTVEPSSKDQQINWQDEYSYVLRDLRTLSIVSAVIFAVMIGAGLFL